MIRVADRETSLEIAPLSSGYSTRSFVVTLVHGEWPSDTDLVTICDNRSFDCSHVRHFGGHVSGISKSEKLVSVYVD